MNQERIARLFGITPEQLEEDARRNPVRRNLLAMCRALARPARQVLTELAPADDMEQEAALAAMFAAAVETAQSVGLVTFTEKGNDEEAL